MTLPCPTCHASTIIARRNRASAGVRFERVCVDKRHRFATFQAAGEPERVTAILRPVAPAVIDPGKIVTGGCNERCPAWVHCTTQKPEFLPCEVYFYPDEDPELLDTAEITCWPGLRLQVNEGAM